jgi:RNA polymerase sigma-70 factor (sigma-E family)
MRRLQGDDDGLAEFVALRGPALIRLGWLLTADAEAAADLVQDALVRVIPKWGEITPAAREAYLRTVIRSIWIDGWRRQGRGRFTVVPAPDVLGLADDGAADLGIEGFGDRAVLADALAQLAPGQRAVLVLRFYEDQTEAQTARALGCSISTVKTQARDALARLRTLTTMSAQTTPITTSTPITTEVPR